MRLLFKLRVAEASSYANHYDPHRRNRPLEEVKTCLDTLGSWQADVDGNMHNESSESLAQSHLM